MALTALARRASSPYPNMSKVLVLLGLFGPVLFYGDSMVTPAISVLSAVEGLFLSRETVISTKRIGIARWRENLFGFLLKNANSNLKYFKLPLNRVI